MFCFVVVSSSVPARQAPGGVSRISFVVVSSSVPAAGAAEAGLCRSPRPS
ncbi:MAG: hypothetical protein HFE80_05285 [Clostridiaceae bacterium]|nr:hypothetical protein [Clostridiaceae bacterium]